jgi:DNA invertase Pin-like site-specific DNA recombinase
VSKRETDLTSKEKPVPAVAYARVSTEAQADDELPISAQIDEIRRFAAARGFEIVDEFIDAGITGRTEDRPEFVRLRKLVSSGNANFSAVIVWRSNRFARSARIAQGFRFLLEQKNIRLFSVTEPEMSGPVGVLMNGILDALNEFYSAQMGEDVSRGMHAAAKAGYTLGGKPPYGLKKVPVMLESGAVKKKFAANEEEAAVVRKIYQYYADGMGLYVIAKKLNRQGIKTQQGREWEQTTIHHVLHRNRQFYLGNTVFNRTRTCMKKTVGGKDESEWIVTNDTHEPIITPEMAAAVDRRHGSAPRPYYTQSSEASRGKNLLNGLMFCGLCGTRVLGNRALVTKKIKDKYNWYYGCTRKKKSTKADNSVLCTNVYVRQEVVEGEVIKEIKKYFCDPERLRLVLIEAQKETEGGAADIDARVRQLEEERKDLEKRRANLLDAVEQGVLPLAEIAARLEKARSRIGEITALLRDLRAAPRESDIDPDNDIDIAAEAIEEMLDDPERRREAFITFVERIDLFPEHLMIKFRVPGTDPGTDPGTKRGTGSRAWKGARAGAPGNLVYIPNSPQ